MVVDSGMCSGMLLASMMSAYGCARCMANLADHTAARAAGGLAVLSRWYLVASHLHDGGIVLMCTDRANNWHPAQLTQHRATSPTNTPNPTYLWMGTRSLSKSAAALTKSSGSCFSRSRLPFWMGQMP
jgi:hypothetical protein